MLQNAPKTEVEKMLKMGIAKEKLTDITVVSQKVDATKAVLEPTAKTGDGRATSGQGHHGQGRRRVEDGRRRVGDTSKEVNSASGS